MRVDIEEKKIGDKLTPSEFNEVVNAINTNSDDVGGLSKQMGNVVSAVEDLEEQIKNPSQTVSTIGELDNVDKTSDDAPDNAVLVSDGKKWMPKLEAFLNTGTASDGTVINNFDSLIAYIGQLAPAGVQRNLRVNNNLDSKNVSASKGEPCPLSFTFISQQRNSMSEPYEDTGERGLCQISVKNTDNAGFTTVKQFYIASGFPYLFDCAEYLVSGANNVMVKVTGEVTGETAPALIYSVQLTSLSLSSTFDDSQVFTGEIAYKYTPVGAFAKIVHFVVDGAEIGTMEVTISNRQQNYTIPSQTHGAHYLEVYMTAEIDGVILESNRLYHALICTTAGDMTPIVASSFAQVQAEQYSTLSIPFIVYNPAASTSAVSLLANGEVISAQTVDRTRQTWSYRVDSAGELTLTISCGPVAKSFQLTVAASGIDVHPEMADLALFLTSVNRSNNEEGRTVWNYGELYAVLTAFNWATNGWVKTIEGFTALRASGDARVTIPYYIFANDFRSTGKTIEFEFETRDVMDYDAVVLSCLVGNIGLQVTAQKAVFRSEQSKVETQFKEDERVRVAFVVEKRMENRLIYVYVNGEMCGVIRYPEQDNFMQSTPAGITVGNNDCTIDTFNIRIYDNNLNRYQLLDNYIADMDNLELKRSLFARNQIYDAYGNVSYDKLLDYVPILTIIGALPAYKGDKVTCTMVYDDRQTPSRCWTCAKVQNDVQGTSSQYYPRKNYKFKYKANILLDGVTTSKFPIRDGDIPVDCFCVKADFAESSGCHNTGLARMIDFVLRGMGQLTPPQKVDNRVRTTIDGYPIVIFHKKSADAPAAFLGKYNFNNDKSTQETFGFTDGCECWELKNNTSDRVKFLASDYAGVDADGNPDWLNDFEARYPDDDDLNAEYEAGKIPANLKRLTDWLVSVKGNPTKFKAEASDYLDIPFLLSYYTLTEFFGMVDQRAKNMFLTTYDGVHWIIIFYDNDTCLGINNEGVNAFDYTIEYHDKIGTQDVWNGEASSLWNNVESAYKDEVSAIYADMRKNSLLTYEVCNRFLNTEQGDRWSESVYNEDSYYKYIRPLLDEGNGSYLYAAQGSRRMHRIWWLHNRFKYMDSKYVAGDFKSDFATMRLYTPTAWTGVKPNADITVTSYSGQYVNVKYGSYTVGARTKKNVPYKITAPAIQFNDTETIIYGASQISSLGDLSALYAGTIDVSKMSKLTELIAGSGAVGYRNTNLEVLSVGANDLLRKLDVRGCPNLHQPIDASRCANIREVWAEGTGTTAVVLPEGGSLSLLHLPETMTNLTVRNQPNLTDGGLTIAGVQNMTTIRWENTNGADVFKILDRCFDLTELKLTTVRLTGIDARLDNLDLLSNLVPLRGIDSNGNVTQNAVVTGKCHVATAAEEQLAAVRSAFPELTVTYDKLIKTPVRTIIVYVDSTTTPVAGAKLVVNGVEYITDAEGKVSRRGGEKLVVSASMEGYKDTSASYAATTVDRTNYLYLRPIVNVKFVVTGSNFALHGATVSCDGEAVNTDINGEAILKLSKGSYDYVATYKGYTYKGYVTVTNVGITVTANIDVPFEEFRPESNGNIQVVLYGEKISFDVNSTTDDYIIYWGDGAMTQASGIGRCTYTHEYKGSYYWNIEIGNCDNVTSFFPTAIDAYWSIGNSKIKGLSFKGITRLFAVGGDIFNNDIDRKDFSYCFSRCNLRSIPAELFSNCISAEDFRYCFEQNQQIEVLPDTLFHSCANAKYFTGCFLRGHSLKMIPSGFFDYCPEASYFGRCFESCSYLQYVPFDLFDKCLNVQMFSGYGYEEGCFSYCRNITSNLPPLWVLYYGKIVDRNKCFIGCTKAANWLEVPISWGGTAPEYIPPVAVGGVMMADYRALEMRIRNIELQQNMDKN